MLGSRYEIGEELASGGMGTIYRGYDQIAQRPIAYKRLKVASEPARARMAGLFQREYETLARLSHPNIVAVHEAGIDAFGPYYTMELLSGHDLAALAPLPFRQACRVLRDVASALALLSARRLVHRDVSPNNVRLTAEGRAKLIDFGGLTTFGPQSDLLGTPPFMAPECVRENVLDARTDLYSLGAVAYWTLTRRTHLRARSLEDLADASRAPLVPPSHYAPDVPRELDELVLALLGPEPVARPGSAAHVIERLTTLAELEPEEDEPRVAYSYLQHAPLRGRSEVVARLFDALAAATAGSGKIVILEAEQGLGRTSTLEHLAIEGQRVGATVIRVRGAMHQTPFSAAHHLVESGVSLLPDVARRGRGALAAPPATRGRSSIDASERQAKVNADLRDALLELSLLNPLVLLLDDAHVVDAESLSLLASMLDVIRRHPILVVLSVAAGDQTQHPQAFQKLEAGAAHSTLLPLSLPDVKALVATMFGDVPNGQPFAAWLFEQTGGNPAQCIDLTRWLLARGTIRYTIGTFTLPRELDRLPANEELARRRSARLSGLSAAAGQVAYLLGMHIGPLTTSQLAEASGLAPRDVLLAFEELVRRGVAVSDGDTLSCASETLRAALCSAQPAETTRAAHLALARAFASLDLDVLENRLATARHLLGAGGAEAFEGACLLARTPEEHTHAMAMSRPTLALLERSLALLAARGLTDAHCVGLLIPLSFAGFFGELGTQRRYLDRAMSALSSWCGIAIAKKLKPLLGPRLGLLFGMLAGLCAFRFRSRALNTRSFVHHLEAFSALPGAASAAVACTWDVRECYRIADWLAPFAYAPVRSPLYLLREFCLANADLLSVKLQAASARYARLNQIFAKRLLGLTPVQAEHLRCGCLLGQAQALVTECAPDALELADQLAQRSTFFAPHAAGVFMTYHAYRGESQKVAEHRERAEALALRGATSWSASSVLVIRAVQACVLTGDVVGLLRAIEELRGLAALSPALRALYVLAQAHLEQLRGHPERAIPVYEQVCASEDARHLPTYAIECTLYAQALRTTGQPAAARSLCLRIIDEVEASGQDVTQHIFLRTREELALAEAELGNFARAKELLASCLERAGRQANPRASGAVQRACAIVALLERDRTAFEQHLAAMASYYRATANPCLIQQCDALFVQAARRELVATADGAPRAPDELDGETLVSSLVDSQTASNRR